MEKEELKNYYNLVIKDPFFKSLEKGTCENLIKDGIIREIKAGDLLIKQGDRDTSMYVILSGCFSIFLDDKYSRRRKLAEISPGGVVGEMSILTHEPRSASIQAVSNGKVLEITQESFLKNLGPDSQSLSFLFNKSMARVKGNFSGWFAQGQGQAPAYWRETLVIILVIFPVVILSNYLLVPYLKNFHSVVGLFISLSITILITSWPVIPAFMKAFDWLLFPPVEQGKLGLFKDIIIFLSLFAFEIIFFYLIYSFLPW